MSNAFTTKNGYLWVQPGGPNTPVFPLGCHDLDDVEEPSGDVSLLRCFDANGKWKTVGQTVAPPDPVTTSITGLQFVERDWLDRIDCTFALYIMQRISGNAGIFANYKRGTVLTNVKKIKRTLSNFVHHEEDNASTRSYDLSAWPPLLDVIPPVIDRIATTETQGLMDAAFCNSRACFDEIGSNQSLCKNGMIVAKSAVGPAKATVLLTSDYGLTWTAAAVSPGDAGKDLNSCGCFEIQPGVYRKIAVQVNTAGTQGKLFFTDNNGASWTTVNIGGAAAGHGAAGAGTLFVLDASHIWLASALGYIYFSSDGGATFTAVDAGLVTTNNYTHIHFADEKYGMAVAALGGIVAKTRDGGITWQAATPITGTPALNACFVIDANRAWVATATGKIFYTTDAGVTWTERTGWVGSGVGSVTDIDFLNEYIGFMNSNNASPVGTVLRTINGGQDWEAFSTPVNTGLNNLWVCDENTALSVGNAQGGTGVILKVKE